MNSSRISGKRSTLARAFACLLSSAALVATMACTQTLNLDGVKSAVSTGVAAKLGLTIASVTCPESRTAKANDTFECTVAPQGGGRLVVKITQKDDQGNVAWEVVKTEGLLDLAALETQIKDGIKAQIAQDVTVACGEKFRAAEPGKTFECTATDAAGTKGPVTVTMKDTEGNVSWSLGQ